MRDGRGDEEEAEAQEAEARGGGKTLAPVAEKAALRTAASGMNGKGFQRESLRH